MRKKSDDLLKHQVKSELGWDTRTWNLAIETEIAAGVVVLSGTVPSYGQKLAAVDAAHRVEGVLDVVDELTVKVPQIISDEKIARSVRQTLERDVLVPDEQIKSTVTDGWVTLEGSVESTRQSEDALEAIIGLAGVVGVTDKLLIKSRKVASEELRAAIEEALERRALREARSIRIGVKDGEVELSGRVHSWQEQRAVVGSISHAPGVKKINDHLRIEPYF